MNKNKSCLRCNTKVSKPLKNDNNETIYWVGAYKGTTDFCILIAGEPNTLFIASTSKKYPSSDSKHYDYYCTDCFLTLGTRKLIVKNK